MCPPQKTTTSASSAGTLPAPLLLGSSGLVPCVGAWVSSSSSATASTSTLSSSAVLLLVSFSPFSTLFWLFCRFFMCSCWSVWSCVPSLGMKVRSRRALNSPGMGAPSSVSSLYEFLRRDATRYGRDHLGNSFRSDLNV
ncbi:hypothetical protein EDD15DRAFT_2327435 [Pisolithus albus]|nr:hypothetical protein EDD15DRAFT_2327435 [Pisolithus albus]